MECPKHERPGGLPADYTSHPAMAAVREKFLPCRFQHLYEPVTVWVPTSFRGTLTCLLPSDAEAVIGSSPTLLSNLTELNAKFFRIDEQEMAAGAEASAREAIDPFSSSARFGFAVLWRHARFSVEHDVPIVLDY